MEMLVLYVNEHNETTSISASKNVTESPAYSLTVEYAFNGVLVILVCLSLVGSLLMCLLMSSAKYRWRSFSVYLRCLAISDTCYMLVDAVWNVDYLLSSIYNTDAFVASSLSVCWTMLMMSDLLKMTSAWILVAMSIDRFIAIVFPLKQTIFCTRRNACISCAVVVVLCTLAEFGSSAQRSYYMIITHACDSDEVIMADEIKVIITTIVTLVLPVTIIAILNVKIIAAIKRSVSLHGKQLQILPTTTEQSMIRRISMSLAIVCLTSLFTLTPITIYYVVLRIIEDRESDDEIMEIMYYSVNLISMLNYCLNFYVLMITGAQYRQDTVAFIFGQKNHNRNTEQA